tara:strand:- start:1329 stop:1892 length:564 start_codon:yes stop_codon:yes gene_type:complete
MEIDKFIKVYDDVFEFTKVASLVKYAADKIKFEDALIVNDKNNKIIEKNIRKTKSYAFNTNSLTSVHWGQYLRYIIRRAFIKYNSNHNTVAKQISTIEILKYEEGGFYNIHSDHHPSIPRTLSVIIFLNNDYEGGELNFHNPLNNEIYQTIKPHPGRCIIWPSNFIYPHSVSPVTKGTRYAIVSWLI